MKKSNVVLLAVAIVASVFLLWLWYFLGFDKIDSPLDLILSIIWWVILAVGVAFVTKLEKTRRESIRTAYVCDGKLYNSESGLLSLDAGASPSDAVASVLSALEYGFDRAAAPSTDGDNAVKWSHVIRTSKFRPERSEDGKREDEVWQGEVVVVETGNTLSFSSRAELARIIG